MERYLKARYDNCIITNEYVVAIGDIPIALVAHLDTVYKVPVRDLYYDKEQGVIWSPEGLGADDRAGIFAIIKILQSGLRPSIILTTDEEKGGLGAIALGKDPCPIKGLKYLIELDRQGENDCVFYNCYCPEFVNYVESFGFEKEQGSFSDISFLMPKWNVCGVNLSVGYIEEHSYSEHLFVECLLETIEKVQKMLMSKDIPSFYYDEIKSALSKYDTIFGQHCDKCKKLFSEYELFPVKGVNSKIKFYCSDCMINSVEWCVVCQEPYETEPGDSEYMCKECLCSKTSKSSSEK